MAKNTKNKETALPEEYIETLHELLVDLHYGSVTLVVQDGRVVQIEKHEKVRLV